MSPEFTTNLGIVIAALLTLAIYSFLYRDNPAYKLAESIYIGIAAGYTVAVVYHTTIVQELYQPMLQAAHEGQYGVIVLRLIPALIGVLMWARFVPNLAYMSRIPMAFMIGMGAGASIPAVLKTDVIVQAAYTMLPLAARGEAGGFELWTSLSNILLIFAVLSVLAYFYFSKPHEGAYGKFSRVGIWFLMIGFGASFGYTVMARISLLLDRVYFLLKDFLGVFGLHIVD